MKRIAATWGWTLLLAGCYPAQQQVFNPPPPGYRGQMASAVQPGAQAAWQHHDRSPVWPANGPAGQTPPVSPTMPTSTALVAGQRATPSPAPPLPGAWRSAGTAGDRLVSSPYQQSLAALRPVAATNPPPAIPTASMLVRTDDIRTPTKNVPGSLSMADLVPPPDNKTLPAVEPKSVAAPAPKPLDLPMVKTGDLPGKPIDPPATKPVDTVANALLETVLIKPSETHIVKPVPAPLVKSTDVPAVKPVTAVVAKPVEGPSLKITEPMPACDAAAMRACPSVSDEKAPTLTPPSAGIRPAGRPAPAVRMVNSKRIQFNYVVNDVGPSGVGGVELWYTADGRSWHKFDTSNQTGPPAVAEVLEEGTYGFTLLAKSGTGSGKQPPQVGELPQVWVEVDLTAPKVQLTDVKPGTGSQAQTLQVAWSASDRNLARRPITLSYAEQATGPWTVIAANLDNTGKHGWKLPASLPARFLLKVEATDLVGNVGSAQSREPVLYDVAQPTVSILEVAPASGK